MDCMVESAFTRVFDALCPATTRQSFMTAGLIRPASSAPVSNCGSLIRRTKVATDINDERRLKDGTCAAIELLKCAR
jgi:hypothetical protein